MSGVVASSIKGSWGRRHNQPKVRGSQILHPGSAIVLMLIKSLFVLLSALTFVSGVALAHARPVRMTPGDGAVLNSPPPAIEIETSQDMDRIDGANELTVLDRDGNEVAVGPAVLDLQGRRILSAQVPEALGPGVYTVRWRTLSAEDNEEDEGTFEFTIDPDASPRAGDTGSGASSPAVVTDGGGVPDGVLALATILVGGLAVAGFAWFTLRPRSS